MADININMFTGNLGSEPQVSYTKGGTSYCRIVVACSESHKNEMDEWIQKTAWIRAVAWGKTGEKIIDLGCTKGDKVFISGKREDSSWKDEKTGETKHETSINIKDFELVSRKADRIAAQGGDEHSYSAKPKSAGGAAPSYGKYKPKRPMTSDVNYDSDYIDVPASNLDE